MVLRSKAETLGTTVATVTFTTMAMATTLTVVTVVTFMMSTTMAAGTIMITPIIVTIIKTITASSSEKAQN